MRLLSLVIAIVLLFSCRELPPGEQPHYVISQDIHPLSTPQQEQILLAAINGKRTGGDAVLVVPVVVHIMHNGDSTESNISNAQVATAIEGLNLIYRGERPFAGGIDTHIQFALASRAPDGSQTNGIVRVDASGVIGYRSDGIRSIGSLVGAEESAVKAMSMWPPDLYLNIWVVTEIDGNDARGNIQGYAYFPGNPLDGVVILHNSFGCDDLNLDGHVDDGAELFTIKFMSKRSRTLAHEVGHSLMLYHTFQDTDTCGVVEMNCSEMGDHVCDTPPAVESFSCTPNCPDEPVANYMGYASEMCQYEFTPGQVERMRACLVTIREGLLMSRAIDR